MKDFFKSKIFSGVLYGIGGVLVVLLIFQTGVSIGYKKASFSFHFGENYYKNFGGVQRFPDIGMRQSGMPDAHGAVGKILNLNLPTFMMEGPDKIEKVVFVDDNTEIRRFRDKISAEELVVNDFVVVVGAPNSDAQIHARLIRVMPESPVNSRSDNQNN